MSNAKSKFFIELHVKAKVNVQRILHALTKKQTEKSRDLTDTLNLERARFNKEKPRKDKAKLNMLSTRFNQVLVKFNQVLLVFNRTIACLDRIIDKLRKVMINRD